MTRYNKGHCLAEGLASIERPNKCQVSIWYHGALFKLDTVRSGCLNFQEVIFTYRKTSNIMPPLFKCYLYLTATMKEGLRAPPSI